MKLEAHENNILKSVVCLHELMTLNKTGRSLPTKNLYAKFHSQKEWIL
jgi:hypothetical protein